MIEREERGQVTVLRMRHGKVQAMDLELLRALDAELERARETDGGRAVVLTGTGSVFSAGVDLFQLVDGEGPYIEEFLPTLSEVLQRAFTYPRPLVAAINGHAIAGGCVLACACDYRVAARGPGTIGLPELRVGVPFPLVPIEIVRFAVPAEHLQELVYLGRTYGVDEAASWGLVDEVVKGGALIERACDVAGRLVAGPPARFALAKRQLRGPTVRRIQRHAAEMDPEVMRAWKDPQTLAAIRSYLEETLRKPT